MTQENLLSRYKILHELGQGAIARVYAARERQTGALVALKRLDPAIASADPEFAQRFAKGARSARLLMHPHIAKTLDAGAAAGTAYVAMELLEGESLRNILGDGPLPVARALRIAQDIGGALAYAHLEGVVHGGLRPSSIIVLHSGAAKLTDFGLGELEQAALGSAARSAYLTYLSPEQLRGKPIDHRCDLFALGALLYEMLTQRAPFDGHSRNEILASMLRSAPALPSELNPLVPRALDRIVLSMLAAQPAARMPGAPILLQELQRLEEGLGLEPGAGAGSGELAQTAPQVDIEIAPAADEFQPITDHEALEHQRAIELMEREMRAQRFTRSRPRLFGALAMALAVAGIGVAGFVYYPLDLSQLGNTVDRMREAPAKASEAPKAPAPPPVAEAPTAPASALPEEASKEPAPPAEPAIPPPPARALPTATLPTAKVNELPPAKPAEVQTQKVAEQQQAGTARLIVAVSPRGDLYIDGKHHGTTPPMTSVDLAPGMHRIEVRSGSRSYLTYMTVEAGEVRRIRHDFNAKPIRPPGRG